MFNIFNKIHNNDVYVIAEMSANHGGELNNALKIVREVAKAGADCLKIQTYTADSLTINCDNEFFKIKNGLWKGFTLYDLYKSANTPYEWHKAIKDECENNGIDFLSTPFDKKAVDFLFDLNVEAFKIASFELVDLDLIRYAASKNKPMIISCGMGSVEEIQDAINACYSVGNKQVVLLKCCSEYPASWEDMHLANIPDMKKIFNLPVGLSDHSQGSIGAIVAVALGANVIEKHVCLKNVKSADSEFSMEISEFSKMVRDVRIATKVKKGPNYELSNKEKESLIFRRSIFAIKDINIGDVFSEDNIGIIRPGYGLKPKYKKEIIGKKSLKKYKKGEPITSID